MILVTGGAGFIGSNVASALAERGTPVVVCDRLRSGAKWRNLLKSELRDLVAPEGLERWLAINGARLDAIVHLGAISSTTETDGDLIADVNIRLSCFLWDWCTLNGKRLVYASSAATYGNGDVGFLDDDSVDSLSRLRPLNAYGWSKHVFDRRAVRLAQQGSQTPSQWVGLKFFNVYGPNEYHKGTMQSVISQKFSAAAAHEPVSLFRSHRHGVADGGQMRDFIYVRDCVDVILWLLERPAVNGIFNLGSGQARSFEDLAHALFAALDLKPRIVFHDMPDEIRDKYQYFTEAPMAKLRAAGYTRPFTTLERGVGDYVNNYLQQSDPYR